MGVILAKRPTRPTASAVPWGAWAALIRLDRTVAAALYVFLGAYLADQGSAWADSRVMRATLVVGLIVAFGFATNDYCDVKVDALGHPERPLPSGRISKIAAARLAWTLAASAIGIAWTLGTPLAVFAVAAACLSAAYSFWLKDTLLVGNACMALLVSGIPIYGALAEGPLTADVLAAALMTFPYFCAQEILYNVEDFSGDRQAGLRTTATRVGRVRALWLVRLLLLVYSLVATVPWAAGIAGRGYLVAVLLCSVFPSLAVVAWLWRRTDASAVGSVVKATRAIWVSSVVPLVLLK